MSTIYDFSVEESHGSQQPLSQYQGKVMLVFNTAGKCGYTPQYLDRFPRKKGSALRHLGDPDDGAGFLGRSVLHPDRSPNL